MNMCSWMSDKLRFESNSCPTAARERDLRRKPKLPSNKKKKTFFSCLPELQTREPYRIVERSRFWKQKSDLHIWTSRCLVTSSDEISNWGTEKVDDLISWIPTPKTESASIRDETNYPITGEFVARVLRVWALGAVVVAGDFFRRHVNGPPR